MEQRKKLIDIMAGSPVTSIVSYESTQELVDHLLANGVVVLPCKVGDTVFTIYDSKLYETPVISLHMHDWSCDGFVRLLFSTKKRSGMYDYHFGDFGNTVFLTREEAEKALENKKEATSDEK